MIPNDNNKKLNPHKIIDDDDDDDHYNLTTNSSTILTTPTTTKPDSPTKNSTNKMSVSEEEKEKVVKFESRSISESIEQNHPQNSQPNYKCKQPPEEVLSQVAKIQVLINNDQRNWAMKNNNIFPISKQIIEGANFVGLSSIGSSGGNCKSDVCPVIMSDSSDKADSNEVESNWRVFYQMMPSFIIAGFGSVFAGLVLNMVTEWTVFENIRQFEIMISAFIGLIGNIETTLASRLSTQANLGRLDHWKDIRSIFGGNMLVIQCQSSTVGMFAALLALVMSVFQHHTLETITWESSMLLCASAVVTSIIANTLLATLIALVILAARRFNINPGVVLQN